MARSRGGFRYLRVGRGRVSVSFRGEDAPSRTLAEIVEAYDGWRGAFRLLDEDLARFDEVVSVAEELAEHIFRGEYRTAIEIWTPGLAGEYSSTKIYCDILLGSRDSGRAAARLVLAFDGTISLVYGEDDPWGEDEAVGADYTATMEIHLKQDVMPDQGPDILVESFVRELAGILGEPDMARALLEGDPWTLYDRTTVG
jgi:hypothetical protein